MKVATLVELNSTLFLVSPLVLEGVGTLSVAVPIVLSSSDDGGVLLIFVPTIGCSDFVALIIAIINQHFDASYNVFIKKMRPSKILKLNIMSLSITF